MPRRRESVGKALRRALGEEVVLPKIETRQPGVSYLMNQRRLQIFQLVFNEPGMHLRELQRRLGVPLQSLRWHVSVLLKAGIIERVATGRKELLFTPLSAGREEMIRKTFWRDPRYGEIVRFMSKRGTASVKELMEETGAYQQLVSARLKTLRACGLVESEGRGPATRYRMSAAAKAQPAGALPEARERLLSLLHNQGLAPRLIQQSGDGFSVRVNDGAVDTELSFQL